MRPFTLRLAAVVSLVLTLISFILAAVTLFAGRHVGRLENYAVLRVNVSMAPKAMLQLGVQQVLGGGGGQKRLRQRSDNSWLDNLESELQGLLDDVVKNITNVITQGVDGFVSDAAAEAKRRLNISDWYSLHIMSTCQGSFTPNATVTSPGQHTTSCTDNVRHRFDIAQILDHQFQIGTRNISLGDLNSTDAIREQVDGTNDSLYALVILLSLAFGLVGAALLSTAGTIARPASKGLVLATLVLTALAATIVAGASIAVTVRTARTARTVNRQAASLGIVVSRGGRFLAVLWTLMALTTIVALTWQVLYVLARRDDARRAEMVKYPAKGDMSRQVAAGSPPLAQREK